MENSKKYIVVTGSNKGIGRATVEGILARNTGHGIILTSRNVKDGQDALDAIKHKYPGHSDYPVHAQLDLNEDASISAFVQNLKDKFGLGSIKVFINNAGVYFDKYDDEANSLTWKVNYVQTKKLTEAILASGVLDSHAKIITVSSMLGKVSWLKDCNPTFYQKFSNYKSLTLQEIDQYAEILASELVDGKESKKNWPVMYNCSKLWVNLWTSALGRALPSLGHPNIQIYSLHPGWVLTDLTRHQLEKGLNPPLNEEQGAQTSIYVALDIPFEVNPELQGEYFDESKHADLVN